MSADDEVVIQFRLRRGECEELYGALAKISRGVTRAARLKVLVIRGFDAERRFACAEAPISASPRADAKREPQQPVTSARASLLSDLIDGVVE